jgi:hypothetical protein
MCAEAYTRCAAPSTFMRNPMSPHARNRTMNRTFLAAVALAAVGGLAVGALAIGAVAIGTLALYHARIERLSIGVLHVERLVVDRPDD